MTHQTPTSLPEPGADPVSRRNLLGLAATAGAAGLTLPVLGGTPAAADTAPTAPEAARRSRAVAVVQRYYAAYARFDFDALRRVIAPDAVWRIPGRHSLSGDHEGIKEILYFFRQLQKGNFGAQVIALVGNDEYAVDYHRGYGSVGGHSIDILWALAYRVRNNQIVEATDFAFDQAAADIFYSGVYPLKPLSQRLA